MRKAELEYHHANHLALENRIATMLGNREFPVIFAVCQSAFPHVAPALKYRKQYAIHPEAPPIAAFSTVCQYAPPLFENAVINSLLRFLRETRALAKHAAGYLAEAERALERQEIARRLWNKIQRHPGHTEHSLCEASEIAREVGTAIFDVWDFLGLIVRKASPEERRVSLRSSLDHEVEGVCPACGARGQATKEVLFRCGPCQQCGTEGYYHILESAVS